MSVGAEAAAAILSAFAGDVGTVPVTFTRGAASTTGNAYVLPPSKGENMSGVWGKGIERGSLSSSSFAFLKVAASGMTLVPQAMDAVTIGTESWTVLGCNTYSLSGIPLIYNVGAQRL